MIEEAQNILINAQRGEQVVDVVVEREGEEGDGRGRGGGCVGRI